VPSDLPSTTPTEPRSEDLTDWQPAPPGAPSDAPPPRPALRRSSDDRVIAGVCGGLARTVGIDAVIVRLLFVVFTLAGGSGLVLYVLAWIVMPEDDGTTPARTSGDRAQTAAGALFGLVLVLVGAWMLVDRYAPRFVDRIGDAFWPLLLVVAGIALILRRDR
jgi:phage shock protein C